MYFGGKNQDYPKDAALDSEGNLYITGQFRDTLDFNGQNAIISTGTQDIFLCKISSEGIFQWVCKYGNSVARGISVDVDANGVYMAGVFFTDSIVVGDSIFYCAPPSGQSDVVVMKHDLNGNLIGEQWKGCIGRGLFGRIYRYGADLVRKQQLQLLSIEYEFDRWGD
jgi:hypothetical protein